MSWHVKFVSPTGVEKDPLTLDSSIPPQVKESLIALMGTMPPGAPLLVETTGHIDSVSGNLKIEIQRVRISR